MGRVGCGVGDGGFLRVGGVAGVLFSPRRARHCGDADARLVDSHAGMALSSPRMMFSPALRQSLKRARRALCESAGILRYSRPSLYDLDRKLERHLDLDGGVFIEAGANDGVRQSNTYYFEMIRGWTGLLIEPVPELAAECRKNRRSPVVEAALAAVDEPGATLELHVAGLMSTVTGALGDAAATSRHVADGLAVQNERPVPRRLRVPARSLSALIDQAGLTRTIDLLSLDVEGAEAMALRGLDLARHAPRFICVETRDEAEINLLLAAHYDLYEVLTDVGTHRDLLFKRR
ncbi:MAG: FkbM family methyltransferase [Opitutus sp.]|nr:FkbM family methyltransferase [Opitutus sp.]